MKGLEKKFFRDFKFSASEIERFMDGARRDLKIAKADKFTEVRFSYAYQALLKAGIALIAKKAGKKVRSIPGHHLKVLEMTARLLNDDDVFVMGNAMRMKRNLDLYGGGEFISEKEAKDYLAFVEEVVMRVEALLT